MRLLSTPVASSEFVARLHPTAMNKDMHPRPPPTLATAVQNMIREGSALTGAVPIGHVLHMAREGGAPLKDGSLGAGQQVICCATFSQ